MRLTRDRLAWLVPAFAAWYIGAHVGAYLAHMDPLAFALPALSVSIGMVAAQRMGGRDG